MSIIIDETKRVLVQGITGREGSSRTRLMLEYGTQVAGGCTPGRAGQRVHGLPVFDSVRQAKDELGPVDISAIFVPAPNAKAAALEAIEAGIPLLALIADRVPLYDVLELVEVADEAGVKFIGPNTVGVMSPERAVLGMMGGTAETARSWFCRGSVGIASRSGGLSASAAYYLSQSGIGVSTIVHVGGDAVLGMTLPEVALQFEQDSETRCLVVIGEIGTSQEEQVAGLIDEGRISKPVVAYIGGRMAESGTRYSHAGAIVEGGRGGYQGKVECLRYSGARVVENFSDIPAMVRTLVDAGYASGAGRL
ncbi:MAG: succinate--CoA ligase subunit alpha [Acidobacteria bacterium]|nr:succinate--CoA ligase subunit alpha [Acidobacteriota bacterium]